MRFAWGLMSQMDHGAYLEKDICTHGLAVSDNRLAFIIASTVPAIEFYAPEKLTG